VKKSPNKLILALGFITILRLNGVATLYFLLTNTRVVSGLESDGDTAYI